MAIREGGIEMGDQQHWAGVDQRHMAALAAVAEQGSFRAAAESLGYVQSAVSDQISYLEQSAGLELVERRKGAASGSLTEAGRRLLRHFDAIAAELAAAHADMRALRGGGATALRAAGCGSGGEAILPGVLADLHRARPDLAITVVDCRSCEEIAGVVAAGELDVAICDLPLPGGPLRRRDLLRDPYVLLVPADWPLARAECPVAISQLAGLLLVGAGGSPSAELLEAELRAAGVEPGYAVRADSEPMARALVGARLGAAIVPRSSVSVADPGTHALDLEPGLSPRTVAVVWRDGPAATPVLDQFVEIATARAERKVNRLPARAHAA